MTFTNLDIHVISFNIIKKSHILFENYISQE